MDTLFKRLSLALALLMLTSCSVAAAISGSKDPNMANVKKGAPKHLIEDELGPARETANLKHGQVSWYTYKRGDEPAVGRAALYLIGDIFTLCMLEYVFFPLEISNSGNAYDLVVTYDKNDKVTAIREPRPNETSLSDQR